MEFYNFLNFPSDRITDAVKIILDLFNRFWLSDARAQIIHQVGHQCGPTRLMACAKPSAVVAIKIFVEKQKMFISGALIKFIIFSMQLSFAFRIRKE